MCVDEPESKAVWSSLLEGSLLTGRFLREIPDQKRAAACWNIWKEVWVKSVSRISEGLTPAPHEASLQTPTFWKNNTVNQVSSGLTGDTLSCGPQNLGSPGEKGDSGLSGMRLHGAFTSHATLWSPVGLPYTHLSLQVTQGTQVLQVIQDQQGWMVQKEIKDRLHYQDHLGKQVSTPVTCTTTSNTESSEPIFLLPAGPRGMVGDTGEEGPEGLSFIGERGKDTGEECQVCGSSEDIFWRTKSEWMTGVPLRSKTSLAARIFCKYKIQVMW